MPDAKDVPLTNLAEREEPKVVATVAFEYMSNGKINCRCTGPFPLQDLVLALEMQKQSAVMQAMMELQKQQMGKVLVPNGPLPRGPIRA